MKILPPEIIYQIIGKLRNHVDIFNFISINKRFWFIYEKHKDSIFPISVRINKVESRINNCPYFYYRYYFAYRFKNNLPIKRCLILPRKKRYGKFFRISFTNFIDRQTNEPDKKLLYTICKSDDDKNYFVCHVKIAPEIFLDFSDKNYLNQIMEKIVNDFLDKMDEKNGYHRRIKKYKKI